MTVQELIDHLRTLPADLPVLVEGYENGWDRLLAVRVANVQPQESSAEWDGEFEELSQHQSRGAGCVLLVGCRGLRRT